MLSLLYQFIPGFITVRQPLIYSLGDKYGLIKILFVLIYICYF
jgi:hypothetical protein